MPKKQSAKKETKSKVFTIFSMVLILAFIGVFVAKKQYRMRNASTTPKTTTYTLSEVAKHATGDNCWMAIGGNVYDVSAFTDKHPKGTKYLKGCGNEATTLFNKIKKHEKIADLLATFKIGVLADN